MVIATFVKATKLKSLSLRLLEKGETVRAYQFGGRPVDIRAPADYGKAQKEFESTGERHLGPAGESTG